MAQSRPVLLLASVCVVGAGAASAADPGPLGVRLVLRVAWYDPTGGARGLEGIARAEVARILRRMGVATDWRVAGPGDSVAADELALVMLERGRVDSGGHVLGASPVSHRAGLVAWVHLPSVRGVLGIRREPTLRLNAVERRTLGVAVGRVAVHEIVHVLAPAVPHGRGLMADRFHANLLSAPIGFDPDVAAEIRRTLGGRLDAGFRRAAGEREPTEALARGPR